MRICICLFFTTVAVGVSMAQSNVVEVTPAFINQLAETARTNHSGLKSADTRVEAARANEETVRSWEDPIIRFGINPAPTEIRESDGDLIYGVEQPLPLWGKPKANRMVAGAATKVEEANAILQFQQLRKEIAQAVFKAALADRVLEVDKQDLGWLETMVAVMEQRYEVGAATQLDVLRLQNERSRRLTQTQTDAQLVEQEQVTINRLLNRPFHSPWPNLALPPIAPVIVYSERLANVALKNEPKLKVMAQQIAEAKAVKDLTRRERYPNVNVGAELRNYSGTGEFRQAMLTVSLSIPWGNHKHYDAAIKREELKASATSLDRADYELAIRSEIHHLTIKIDVARREALTYRDDIVPRSQTALESARAGWESNTGMFRDVLEARRMLLEAQLTYARAVSEQYQLLSELVLCCGVGDLEALQQIGSQFQNSDPQPEK
jgi:outer membrane protein TolC